MSLALSVECELGEFVDFELPAVPFNGIIFTPEIPNQLVIPGLWLHMTYPEAMTGDWTQVSVRELRITSNATYFYEADRPTGKLYLARRAVNRSGLTVQFWSY